MVKFQTNLESSMAIVITVPSSDDR